MFKKSKKIDFIKNLDIGDIYLPYPTKKKIPDWYKETESNYNKEDFLTKVNTLTIKKCIPIFDSLSSGYIITTFCDTFINQQIISDPIDEGKKYIIKTETPNDKRSIEFHEANQAKNHPLFNNKKIPKFINAWGVKTPPGYSCLFINPMHNPSKIFTILEGIVDTDSYHAPVNFPFVFNDPDFTGLIPAGTPIAQIIPFKRDSWNMQINNKKSEAQKTLLGLDSLFLNKYKTLFWSRKEYN